MKIFVITPIVTGIYKDDTEMFCEGLEKYFNHEIVRAEMCFENGDIIMLKEFNLEKEINGCDVIWAPYEPLIPVALYLRKTYKIPIVGHFEVVPPGRVNLDNVFFNWIYSDIPPEKNDYYWQYKFLGDEFLKCDIKTIIGLEQKYEIEKLVGKKIKDKTYIKPYPLDNEMLEKYRDENIKEKNQIASILTLTPHKRPHHIIKALSLLKNPPKLIIIGKNYKTHLGESVKEKIYKYVEKLGLDIEFTGTISDKEKAKIIQESMFLVHPWACLPVGESAFFKKACISYDEPILRDRLNEMPYYTESNNIPELAKTMQKFIDEPELRKSWGIKAYNELIEGKTETYLLKEACKRVNETLVLGSKIKVE